MASEIGQNLSLRLRKFCAMTPAERRHVLRSRKDDVVSVVVHQWWGQRLNRSNRYLYVSYVPDAIRLFDRVPDFRTVVARWVRGHARDNAGDVPRLLALLSNAQLVIEENVAGDFAEVGVYKGHTAQVLAGILARQRDGRRLYLFDTFSGFDEQDVDEMTSRFTDTSLESVARRIGHDDICVYRPGYFPDSATDVDAHTSFSFVHLDCDLYNPTAAALRFFYPRLSAGAFVAVHDYASGHWPGVTRAVDEFLADKPESVVLIPDKSGTAVFRRTHA